MRKAMHVVLNRSNDLLEQLVRDALADIFGDGATLTVSSKAPAGADLVIWDFQPGDSAALSGNEFVSKSLTLFVASESDLWELESAVGQPVTNVILKPVEAAALSAFLQAASSAQARQGRPWASTLDSLRAQRDDLLRALMQANVRLQEFGRDRTIFLTRAVHDFQAPLSALTGYCGLLLSGRLGPVSEQQREVLGRMRQSAVHLSELTEGMLDVSAGLRAEFAPAVEEVDLRECVQKALDRARPVIEEKSLDISIDLAAPAGPVRIDASRLGQVCCTLVENACRFSPRGGYLEIAGYPVRADYRTGFSAAARQSGEPEPPNCYRLDFRDAGPEIRWPPMADIFEEHISVSPGYDRAGAGLGLATCRMIIAQHGGDIWAENSESGAVFSFVLPFAAGKAIHAGSQAAYA